MGGLASALRLRRLGCEVDVLESCGDPGGRARTFNLHGHEFDAGPTVITAPWLFDELFALFGERREDYVEFLPCDPWYRISYADGSSLDLCSSYEEQEREIARVSPADAAAYARYLAHSEKLYQVGYERLGAADFTSFTSMLRVFPDLIRLRAFRTLWRHTAAYFRDPRVRQAFSLQTLLVGGNPLSTTAIYGLIHAMERKGGIWFARGGTRQLVRALVALGERHGIRFHYGARVTGFAISSGKKVEGVTYSNEMASHTHPCDLCVWGGDPIYAYRALDRGLVSWIERALAKTARPSMGLYVLYFKTAKRYPEVAHHTIVLSERWESLLREIFHGAKLPHDPSLYLHRPAATDPGHLVDDGELFYVLAPVPHLGRFAEWEERESEFRRIVLSILEQRALPGLRDSLCFAESVDPRYFRDHLLSDLGAGFSIAPLLSQSAWFRFHNRADRVRNLYLCGAGAHPGAGLPGVITSAKVVERLVRGDFPRLHSRCATDESAIGLCA